MAAFGYPAALPIAADERRHLLGIAGDLGLEASVAVPGALLALLGDDRAGAGAPAIGATGLMPRLLRARCCQLGLMHRPPTGGPWRQQEVTEVRRRLADALADEALSQADAIRLIGRPLELLDRLWWCDPHGYLVLDPTGNGSSAFEGLRVNAAGEFEQRLLPFMAPSSDGPRTPDLHERRGSIANRLALRGLQLWLWRLGLLEGPVSEATDYHGPTSAADRQRLADLCEALALVAGPGDAGRSSLRRKVGGNYWAINLRLLVPRLAGLTGPALDALLAEAATGAAPPGTALRRVIGAAAGLMLVSPRRGWSSGRCCWASRWGRPGSPPVGRRTAM